MNNINESLIGALAEALAESLRPIVRSTICEVMQKSMEPEQDTCGIEEASKIVGLKKSTIYIMTHKKQIPHFKRGAGGRLYFSRKALRDWIVNKGS